MSAQPNAPLDKREDYKERRRRWQGISIQQVTFVNNLFIGLSSALVFWQGQYLLGKDVTLRSCFEWEFYLGSALLFLISLAVGCVTAWNRTKDFRQTAMVDTLRAGNDEQKQQAKKLSEENKKLGERTWRLLYAQGIVFLLGILFFVIAIVAHLLSLWIVKTR